MDDLRLNLIVSRMSAAQQWMASVLAVALPMTMESIAAVAASTNEDFDRDALDEAARTLMRLSIVEQYEDGVGLRDAVAQKLADRFLTDDPSGFRRVHERFLEQERLRLQATGWAGGRPETSSSDEWEIAARLAFYLAALDTTVSEAAFADAFDDAPMRSVTPSRLWLGKLGLRQSYLLGDESRTVVFSRAFNAYIDGRRKEAADGFFSLSRSGTEDVYSAISMHLWSVLEPDHPESEDVLTSSVALSSRLELTRNEVMARNTLVFRKLEEGRDDVDVIRDAVGLAQTNLHRAREVADRHLLAWCLHAFSVTSHELRMLEVGSVDDLTLTTLLPLVDEAYALAREAGDIETEAYSLNEHALLLRDAGRPADAVGVISDWLLDLGEWRPDVGARRKLAKTLGSMRHATIPREARASLERGLGLLGDWARR